jgi:hypothetical protein
MVCKNQRCRWYLLYTTIAAMQQTQQWRLFGRHSTVSMTCKSHCHAAMHHLYSTVTACVICISHCYAWNKMRHSDSHAWYAPAKVMHILRQPRSCMICYDTDMHCMHCHSQAWCATATAIHDTQQLQSCVTCKSQPCAILKSVIFLTNISQLPLPHMIPDFIPFDLWKYKLFFWNQM